MTRRQQCKLQPRGIIRQTVTIRHNRGVDDTPAGPGAAAHPHISPEARQAWYETTMRRARVYRDKGQLTDALRMAYRARSKFPDDPAAVRLSWDILMLHSLFETLGYRQMPEDGHAKKCTSCNGAIFGHQDAMLHQCLRCRVMQLPRWRKR